VKIVKGPGGAYINLYLLTLFRIEVALIYDRYHIKLIRDEENIIKIFPFIDVENLVIADRFIERFDRWFNSDSQFFDCKLELERLLKEDWDV